MNPSTGPSHSLTQLRTESSFRVQAGRVQSGGVLRNLAVAPHSPHGLRGTDDFMALEPAVPTPVVLQVAGREAGVPIATGTLMQVVVTRCERQQKSR